jgi:hypothetical protein
MKKSTVVCLLALFLAIQPLLAQHQGNGHLLRETRELRGFTGIDVGASFDVYLKQGRFDVTVEIDENLQARVTTEVRDGILYVDIDGRGMRRSKKATLYISLPELTYLQVSGACDLKGMGTFATDQMKIDLSGASDVDLDLDVDELTFEASGAADATLTGVATKAILRMSGSADLAARGLINQLMEVRQSGASSAQVHCEGAIQGSLSGSSDLHCQGQPASRKVSQSGASEAYIQ